MTGTDEAPGAPAPPDDPLLAREVLRRVVLGEGRRLELKRGLPGPAKVARTLAAFANGAGGLFAVGVDDDGRVVGAPRPEGTAAELADVAARWVRPPVAPRVWVQRVPGGERLVVAWVGRSVDAPHAARAEDGRFEVTERRAASTRECEAEAVERARAAEPPLDGAERAVLAWVVRATARGRPSRTTPARIGRATGLSPSRLRRALHRLESTGRLFGFGPDGERRFAADGPVA